jgi:hypothetical protein
MMRRFRRFIAMLMMAFALTAMSALPAFAGGNEAEGGEVECELENEETILTANVQTCLALGGIVVSDNEVEIFD